MDTLTTARTGRDEQPATMKKPPHILFHRGTSWHSNIQCSTKTYSKRFHEAGYRVSYLQGLAHPAHLLLRSGYYDTWKRGSRWEDGIWVGMACGCLPVIQKVPAVTQASIEWSYRFSYPGLRSVVGGAGWGDPDVIWTTSPGSTVLRRLFPNAKLIFHVVDYYPAFRGEGVKKIEKQDYAVADHVFSIGHALASYLEDELEVPPEKITVLGQGAPLEQYSRRLEAPEDLQNIPGPIATWVGVCKKLDPGLLAAAANAMKAKGGSVVLIGPTVDWLEGFVEQHDNVHLLGSRASEVVPAYLQHSDLGLMLYNRERADVYYGQNPLKLYEYAAAGLPVVSTDHREYNFLEIPVEVVAKEEETTAAVTRALENREEMGAGMRNFAQDYSWARCVSQAEGVIEKLLKK